MQRVITGLVWLLVAAAIGVLFGGPFLPGWVADASGVAVQAGLLVALGGNLLTAGKNAEDAAEKRSAFFFDSASKAYEQARLLLAEVDNDRVTWIEAARCLGHAKALSEDVTVESHRRVLELNRLKYRSFFHETLSYRPATFFYGAEKSSDLDGAARASTAPEERNGRVTTSSLNELDEASIRMVWEAAQWPENYVDPLGNSFSDAEQAKLLVLFPELHRHLEHRRQWHSASGQLFPRQR